jgi:hypothetical protein
MRKNILLSVQTIAICVVSWFVVNTLIANAEDAVTILEKCTKNISATENIQCNVKADISYTAPKSDAIKVRSVQSTICKDGDRLDVRSEWTAFSEGKISKSHLEENFVTDGYAAVNIIEAVKRSNSIDIIVANKSKDILATPILGGLYYGFALDGFLGDKLRFTDMMLSAKDKIEKIGEEKINNFPCVQLRATTKYGLVTAWIDVNNGYVARKVACFRDQNSLAAAGTKYTENFPDGTSFQNTIEYFDFKNINGNYISTRGRLTVIRIEKDNKKYGSTCQYERDQIILSPDFSGKNLFNTDHLKNERVNNVDDDKSGVAYVWDGEKSIPYVGEINGEIALRQKSISVVRFVLILVGAALLLTAVVMLIRQKIRSGKSL